MSNNTLQRKHYGNLDGLRAISCLLIIFMHVKSNTDYNIHDFFYRNIVTSWTQLVPLFLMVSGFGMFCGYYERVKSGTVNMNDFFSRRYKKILPFFAVLMLVDVVLERSVSHIIEALTQLTLVFGLLPNNSPEVIGVCWTIGVIFLFYMLFPFVVFLCWTKRRAWISFAISIAISVFCSIYYFTDKFVTADFTPRHSFLYCAPFFIGGGLIFLYRDELAAAVKKLRFLALGVCVALTVGWYFVPASVGGFELLSFKNLVVFMAWLIYAVSVESPILSNKVMKYLGSISMEMYLAQMVVFRFVEKLGLLYIFGNGYLSFAVACLLTVGGLIAVIELWKLLLKLFSKLFGKKKEAKA